MSKKTLKSSRRAIENRKQYRRLQSTQDQAPNGVTLVTAGQARHFMKARQSNRGKSA